MTPRQQARERLASFAKGPEGGVISFNIDEVRQDLRLLLSSPGEEEVARVIRQALAVVGQTHGPNVETYTCPVEKLVPAVQHAARTIIALFGGLSND